MRWLTFTLLATLAIGLQTTVALRLEVFTVRPDFVFILLVHYALHSRNSDGLIAGWLLGVLVDLTSVERLGVVALIYGLSALAIWSLRDLTFRKHPLTHLTVTFLFCLLAQLMLCGYYKFYYGLSTTLLNLVVISLASAVYTGLCAVPIHCFLLRFSRILGLGGSKYDHLPSRRQVRVV